MYTAILEPGHYLAAFPLLTRSFVQLKLDNPRGAEESAAEATRILSDALPEGHFATTMGECRLGQAFALQRRFEEARTLLEKSVAQTNNEQMPSEYRAECREALARLYESTGRIEEATEIRSN